MKVTEKAAGHLELNCDQCGKPITKTGPLGMTCDNECSWKAAGQNPLGASITAALYPNAQPVEAPAPVAVAPPPAPPRKLVVTKSLIRKLVNISNQRFVAPRRRDPTRSLTFCRDNFWKKYPHFYRRAAKALYKYGLNGMGNPDYDGYADWLNRLDDYDLTTVVKELEKKYVTPPSAPAQSQQPQPQPQPGQPQQGQPGQSQPQPQPQPDPSAQAFEESLAKGGGPQQTPVEIDPAPQKFRDIKQEFETHFKPSGASHHPLVRKSRHTVEVERQHQLMARIKRQLMSITQCKVKRDLEDGDLDMERLTDIATGTNLRGLFMKTTSGRALSVACQIYIDVSGSMRGHCDDTRERKGTGTVKEILQMRLCVALGTVLERLRVPYQLIAFDDQPTMLKDFDNRLSRSLFWNFDMSHGGTTLINAMQAGFPLLQARREHRKVAIILTDGDVGSEGKPYIEKDANGKDKKDQNGNWAYKKDRAGNIMYIPATIDIRKQFPMIETCGFGIGGQEIPENAFDHHVDELKEDLVEKVTNTVAQVIVRKA